MTYKEKKPDDYPTESGNISSSTKKIILRLHCFQDIGKPIFDSKIQFLHDAQCVEKFTQMFQNPNHCNNLLPGILVCLGQGRI